MPVKNIEVGGSWIVLDSVTLDVDIKDGEKISIQNHPSGPCLVCTPALAVITNEQADMLINAGITDKRRR
jgi:hypothetical protein